MKRLSLPIVLVPITAALSAVGPDVTYQARCTENGQPDIRSRLAGPAGAGKAMLR